mgnify:CR=1 FL=1
MARILAVRLLRPSRDHRTIHCREWDKPMHKGGRANDFMGVPRPVVALARDLPPVARDRLAQPSALPAGLRRARRDDGRHARRAPGSCRRSARVDAAGDRAPADGERAWCSCAASTSAIDAAARMPATCEVFEVTPLLRELIVRATELPLEYDERGAGRAHHAPAARRARRPRAPALQPADAEEPRRSPRSAAGCIEAPDDAATLEDRRARRGISARTLARHFRRQTGMSFAEWRRRARLLRALGWIAEGRPILEVALDLGYDSPSAFSAMFRRELGAPPSSFRAT